MQRLTSDRPVPDHLRGGVVALGNFDGFHRGHQAVAGRARAIAREQGRPLVIATFEPHPVRWFRPDAPPFQLTTIPQRARLFEAFGADAMLTFRFDATLAAVPADAFVRDWLGTLAGAAVVVTGEDFTFGKARSGSIGVLAEHGAANGIATQVVTPIADGGGPVSSSRIRAALQAGDCEAATAMLTRPYVIEGIVQHGDKVGRTIGYPTANMAMRDYLRPAYGIYAARGRLADGRILDGAANLGIRPTFDPPKELLEPHFFDFAESLYDLPLAVELVSWIRPEARFDGLDALIAQMDADCAEARRRLAAQA